MRKRERSMGYFNDYIGMSPKEALMTFCDKYFAEGYSTENGVIASYIKRYIEEDSVSIEHHEDELQSLEEDYYKHSHRRRDKRKLIFFSGGR